MSLQIYIIKLVWKPVNNKLKKEGETVAIAITDVNKSVIMQMLQTDVFGFSAEDIEAKAKEVHNLVVNGDDAPKLRMVGGYGRTEAGNIGISYNGFFHTKAAEKPAKGKKK